MKTSKLFKAGSGVLLCLFLAGMVSVSLVEKETANRPLAYVQKYKPLVQVDNEDKQIIASRAERLYSGDTLSTDENGFALVQFMDKSIAKVKPQSQLIIQGSVDGKANTSARINLEAGEVFLNITKRNNSNFEVASNTSVASVKGTQFGASSDDYYWVLEGVVEMLSNRTGGAVDLTENMFGRLEDDGSIITGALSAEDIEELNRGYEQLESKLEPKGIKLKFRDENGQVREIEMQYFEN